ncbi:MAG: nucleoside phosphorylase [Chitinophagales bacterium]|nr:nucleoside phosphorylase [Chitinophagales bacterium]
MTKTFPPSELILTPEGAIYHLNLKPKELADLVITVGDPDRVKMVSAFFDKIEVKRQHREFVTHTGYIGKKRISVVSTGIGTDNIDIVLNELDALKNIDFKTRTPKAKPSSLKIIRIGTSGSMQADLPVDTILISQHSIGLDNLMHYYKRKIDVTEKKFVQLVNENLGMSAYCTSASDYLVEHFSHLGTLGTTVTCPGFYAPQGRILRYSLPHKDLLGFLSTQQFKKTRITNFEMETAGIYGLGALLGHQCLSINLLVANRVDKTFSTQADKKMKALIKVVLKKIVTL